MDNTTMLLCSLLFACFAVIFILVEFSVFIIVMMVMVAFAVSVALLDVPPPSDD